MNRRTAVGLCTCVILAGCALGDAPSQGASANVAAQQVETIERTVHGAVRGTYGDKPFTAVVVVTEFLDQGGVVRAIGSLTEVAGVTPDEERVLESATLDFPVSVGPVVRPQVVPGPGTLDAGIGAVCDVLYVRLPPQERQLEGRALQLDDIQLDVEAHPSVDSVIGRLLCEVSALLDPAGSRGGPTPDNVRQAVKLLNDVVAANRDAVPDGGTLDVPAVDAGTQKPAVAYDASTPLRM